MLVIGEPEGGHMSEERKEIFLKKREDWEESSTRFNILVHGYEVGGEL
jgi:hypothetical protein